MAVTSISFDGTEIAAGDAAAHVLYGFDFTPGVKVRPTVVSSAEVGQGHWLKSGNTPPVDHQLIMTVLTTDFDALRTLVEGLADAATGTLSVTGFDDRTNCVMSSASFSAPKGAQGGQVSTTIQMSFTEY